MTPDTYLNWSQKTWCFPTVLYLLASWQCAHLFLSLGLNSPSFMGIMVPTTQCDKFERNSIHLLQGWGKIIGLTFTRFGGPCFRWFVWTHWLHGVEWGTLQRGRQISPRESTTKIKWEAFDFSSGKRWSMVLTILNFDYPLKSPGALIKVLLLRQ